MSLQDRVVVVTGASSGIGAAIAVALGGRGARLGLVARHGARLEEVAARVREAGGQALVLATDITDRAAVRAMRERVVEELGEVEVLVNNAGVSVWQYVVNCDQDSWDLMIDVNIRGVLNCLAAFLPSMVSRGRGDIVNMSSVRGREAGPGGAVYAGTKQFLEGLTASLRAEVAASGVKVTSVQPGLVDTPLVTGNLERGTDKRAVEDRARAMEGMVTMLRPEQVAEAVVFVLLQPRDVSVPVLPVMAVSQGFS